MSTVKIENISKKFGSKEIFHNFSMEIEDGDFVCISGESGKGKSTLLNMIGLLDTPDSGDIIINGKKNVRFNSKDGRELMKNKISYVFQNYGLVDDQTVEYNLMISGRFSGKNKKGDLENALERVGLSKDVLDQKVFTLSGGEQQRVALARIYLKDSDIILADEPTGSLDANNRDKVMYILKDMNDIGKTVIIVTHDAEVVKCAKRTVQI